MEKNHGLLELLSTLILSTDGSTVKVNKNTLRDIQKSLQYAQEKIDFLRLESQLQQEELKQRSHSEHVSVQNFETDPHQQQVNNVTVHSDKAVRLHADAEVQLALPKPIIKPWEHLVHNKHRTGLGYDKDVFFHIPDYSKPTQF